MKKKQITQTTQKHNKKRNTAFIFEALVRELTKSIIEKNDKKKKVIISLVKENFKSGTLLGRDLDLYKGILETKNIGRPVAEKLIFESRMQHCVIDAGELFKEQTELINKINKLLSKDVFANFVPNYRNIATVYQIFNPHLQTKQRVLMEEQIINQMINENPPAPKMKALDNLTFKTFATKFNEKYQEGLILEQRKLLNKYISSFGDNGLELKIYLNEEVSRLRRVLENISSVPEINDDIQMVAKTKNVLNLLEECSKREIDERMIQDVLKVQRLVKEISS
tara:strand:+ start:439 stop:1281 length:843 start_codon:yes stop_codon:yes gene_type:complete